MIYVVCVATALLFCLLWGIRRQMTKDQRTRKFSYLLVDNALTFLGPFLGVSLFYVVLSLVVRGSDDSTIERLRLYERLLVNVNSLLRYLKLTPAQSMWLLVISFGLILVTNAIVVFRPLTGKIERFHSLLAKYHKGIGRLSTVITLLGSFTFFGGTVPRELGRLDVTIKDIRQQSEGFRAMLEEELRWRVAANLMDELPPAFTPVLLVCHEIDKKQDELARDKSANSDYKVKSSEAEALSSASLRSTLEATVDQTVSAQRPQKSSMIENENLLSISKIRSLRSEVQTYVSRSAQLARTTFETPLGSRIGTTLLKMLISERHIPALESLTIDIPLAGPLVSILTDSVRKKTSMVIAAAADRLAASAFENPTSLDKNITDSAKGLAPGIALRLSAIEPVAFTAATALAQNSLGKVDAAQKDFQTRLEEEKNRIREQNRVLIAKLRGRIERKTPSSSFPSWKPKSQLFGNKAGDFNLSTLDDMREGNEAFYPNAQTQRWRSSLESRDVSLRNAAATMILEEPQRKRLDEAVRRLIDAAEGFTDPITQNRLLNSIDAAVSKTSLSARATNLARVAEQDFGRVESAKDLTEIATEVQGLEAPPSHSDSFRAGGTKSFDRTGPSEHTRIEPIRIEPIRIRPMPRR